MTSLHSSKSLSIRTKDLLAIFSFSKLMSSLAFLYLMRMEMADVQVFAVSHLVSLSVFFGLLHAVTRTSLSDYIRMINPKKNTILGIGAGIAGAISAGFLIRFGVEGIYIIGLDMYDHDAAKAEFIDLLESYSVEPVSIGLLLVTATLIGAIDEEFIYRGALQGHFQLKYGIVIGSVVASMIFGLIHLNPITFFVGICLSIVFLASGRLWLAVIAHASGNMAHPAALPLLKSMDWSGYLIASAVSAMALILSAIVAILIIIREHAGRG